MYQKRNKELEIIKLYTTNYKKEFYLRQISKLAELALKTCQNTLAGLEKENILKSRTDGKNKYFRLNLSNIQTKSRLLQAEIYKLDSFIKKYPQINMFLKSLNTNTPLIVFGSFAKLKADKNSDLDLLVLSSEKQDLPFHCLPYKVHEINLFEESFKKALSENEAFIQEIQDNHVILNNPSFYINITWEHYGK